MPKRLANLGITE